MSSALLTHGGNRGSRSPIAHRVQREQVWQAKGWFWFKCYQNLKKQNNFELLIIRCFYQSYCLDPVKSFTIETGDRTALTMLCHEHDRSLFERVA
jgi:hypothetical protein